MKEKPPGCRKWQDRHGERGTRSESREESLTAAAVQKVKEKRFMSAPLARSNAEAAAPAVAGNTG